MEYDSSTSTDAGRGQKLRYFSAIFAPLLVLCAVALGNALYSDYSRLRTDIASERTQRIDLITASLQNNLDTLYSQTDSLVREAYLNNYINGVQGSEQILTERYRSIAANAAIIYQLQLIDAAGNETVRITSAGGAAQLTPEDELRNVEGQDYFVESMSLAAGERYVSDTGAYRRGDQASDPAQAVTIYGTPLFTESGERWGVLALWVNSGALIERLMGSVRSVTGQDEGQVWVLDRDGNWLYRPESENPGQSLEALDPELWNRLRTDDQSSFLDDGNLYTRTAVCGDLSCSESALDAGSGSAPWRNLPASGWHIVSMMPAEAISPGALLLSTYSSWLPLAVLMVFIALLIGWVSWRLASSLVVLRSKESELVRLNAVLQAEKDTLEQRVADRTHQLASATEKAESANKAKSAFLATMSHEIRTPMNGVIGSVDVLRQSSLRPRQLEQTEVIRDSAYALLSIIDDILDFSKIEAEKITLENEPVRLPQLIDSICSSMTSIADRKHVKLKFYRSPELPVTVLSDAIRLRQIITNLVGNAIKFSSRNKQAGRVAVRFGPDEHGRVSISVEDNGIGMDEGAMSKIFGSFSQADESTARRFGGTGLGLAITQRLIELMSGEIDVQSTPEVGSTFTVSLPVEVMEPCDSAWDAERLSGVSCVLVTQDEENWQDWTAWLQVFGADVRRERALADVVCADGGQRKVTAVIALSDSSGKEEMRPFIEEMSPGAPEHLVAIRPLIGLRVEILGDNTVLINKGPNRNKIINDVQTVLDGNAQDLVDPPEKSPEATQVIDRAEAVARGRLVLIAEDNEINQDVIKSQLDLLGYAYDVADHGAEALELWTRNGDSYALLLTDLHMPIMDGYVLTEAIRRQEAEGSRLPILAFTADATKSERAHCFERGMDDYLTKPLSLDTLEAKLRKWSRARAQDDEEALGPDAVADTGPASPVFDSSVLAGYLGSDRETVARFLRKYRESAVVAGEQIIEAEQRENWHTVGEVAHKLKSSSRALGAMALADSCDALELQIHTDNSLLITKAVASFLVILEDTVKQIDAHTEEHGNYDRTD